MTRRNKNANHGRVIVASRGETPPSNLLPVGKRYFTVVPLSRPRARRARCVCSGEDAGEVARVLAQPRVGARRDAACSEGAICRAAPPRAQRRGADAAPRCASAALMWAEAPFRTACSNPCPGPLTRMTAAALARDARSPRSQRLPQECKPWRSSRRWDGGNIGFTRERRCSLVVAAMPVGCDFRGGPAPPAQQVTESTTWPDAPSSRPQSARCGSGSRLERV